MARLCVLIFLAVLAAVCVSCAVAQEKKVAGAEKVGGEQAGVVFAGESSKPGEQKSVISIREAGREEKKFETEHTVYVPYRELEKVFEKSGRGVYLPYEEFLQLWQKAKEAQEFRALPPVAAVITGASYECLIKQDEDIATVKSTFAIEVLEKSWVQLPLAFSGIALQEVKLDGMSALLSARQNDYLLILKEKGRHALAATFAVKLDKRPDQRILSFGVPRTPVSRFAVTIAEPDLDVEIEPKLLATKTVTPDGQKTEILAFVGSTDKVSVIYRPKPKEAVVLAGLFFSNVSTHVLFSERLMTAHSQIDYEILQKLNRLEVKLPPGWNLLSVAGADIKDWQIEGEGADRVLRVDLFAEAKNSYSLSLRLEMGIEKAEGTFAAPALSVVGSARESGYVALAVSEGLRIKGKETENVSQVDESELPAPVRRGKVDLAFRYLRHPYKLSVELSEVKPKITLRNDSLVTVTPEFVTLSCALRYTVERRGIFSAKIDLPKNYTVLRCGDPSFVKDYRVKDGEKVQTLEVDFTTRLSGAFTLYLLLQSPRKVEEESVALPFAHDTACEKESGFMGICVKTNLKVTTEESSGLTPIDVNEFLSQVGDLRPESDCPLSIAYQFFRYPVSAKFKVEKQKPKVAATVLTQLSFEESLLKVQTTVKYTVLYAGIRKLKFSVADKIGESAHISGASIKEIKFTTEGDVVTWDIELQGDTLGEYLLSVSYDIKIAPTSQTPVTVTIPETTVLEVFEENGYFALCKKETLLLNVENSAGLELIDVKELPELLARALPYESYKYIAHPYSLSFSVLKQEFEKVLSTVVNHMHIESELSKEFIATSKMVCLIQSKATQSLTFVMPSGSEVFKLYVNRKEAKFSWDDPKTRSRVVVNLSEYAPTETEFPIEIVYQNRVSEKKDMSCCGHVETILPAVQEDVPVCRLSARLYLPRQFKYTTFGGNMRRIGAPEEKNSLWFWGKSLLFPPAREQASDAEILRRIDAICRLFATGTDMITVQLTGEGERFTFIKQGSGAEVSVTYFGRNFFWALDIVILLITLAGLLLIVRLSRLPRIAVSIFAILLFLILATLSRGAAREFLNTAFFGSLIASLFWFVSYVVRVERERRYLRESHVTVAERPEQPAPEEEVQPEKEEPKETPPSAQEEGGESDE